ncbi:MAG: hypothetical protein ACXV8U_20310 [Methylobacter sp.]
MTNDPNQGGIPQPTSPSQGWEQFYNTLATAGNVPNASITSIAAENAVFYGNYLDIGEIQKQIATSGITPAVTTIYTDILNVSDLAAWQLTDNTGLVIYARLIEFQAGASFYVNLNASTATGVADVMVFSSATNGEILVNTGDGSSGNLSISSANISPGIGISCTQQGGLQSRTLTLAEGFPATMTSDQESYLFNSFIFGALCYDQNPDIALSILLWVQGWAGASNNPDLYQLFFRSTNLSSLLSSQIIAKKNNTTYVPYLSSSVYQNLATAMGAELVNDETNYIQLFTTEIVTQGQITQATALAQNSANQVTYIKQLLTQAEANCVNTNKAVNIAQLNFLNQQDVVTIEGNNLKLIGIPAYKQKVIIMAVFDMVKAIVEFGVGIAGMLTGNEETAPAAAEGAATAVDAAKAVETAVIDGKAIVDAMEQLKQLIDVLQKVYELSQALYTAGSEINGANGPADQFADVQKISNQIDSADVNGLASWSVFKLQADNSVQPLIDNDIEYAASYKEALDTLVIYGQALCAAQLAAINASQQYAALSFQLYYADENAKNMATEVANLKAGQAPILKLQQLFFQKYLDSKTTLFTILKNYQATYYYWALQSSSVNPSLIDLANKITKPLNDLTQMSFDQYNALINFGHGPQTMAAVQVSINKPSVIQNLQSSGKAQWFLPLTEKEFANFDRVRFSRIRIWLEGNGLYDISQTAEQIVVNLGIKTSGNYEDKFKGQEFRFNSAPLQLDFEYTVSSNSANAVHEFANNLYAEVNVDGSSAPGFENDYFEPTPFSTWGITLPSPAPAGMDYSKITSIIMEFQGSVIDNNFKK